MRTERAPAAGRWLTVPAERTVLGVIHNVTSATRLLDLLAVFEGDPRVRVVFTCTGSSAFEDGIAEFVADHELSFIPWETALAGRFDLAVSTSRGGNLHDIPAPLIGSAHGAGYNKKLSRKPEAGSRKPEAGDEAEAEAFGLSAEWLLHDGGVIPSALTLSHDDERARLRTGCPEALPYAHVIGDPCADELHASAALRTEYRAALGIRPDRKLVLVTSTWGDRSLLGASFDTIQRALAELPFDEYRVIAAIHPNAWYKHGGDQIRRWLARSLRAGLLLPHPAGPTWKAALCAADAYIGDHGSVSLYAAALGLPGLLSSFDEDVVAPGSPMAWLGSRTPRVSHARPLGEQLADAAPLGAAAARVTSRPGEALPRLRALCYARLGLPEPEFPCVPRPVPLPAPVTAYDGPIGPALYVDAVHAGEAVTVRRYPAALQGRMAAHLGQDVHVVADEAEPEPRWRNTAEVLLARRSSPAELFARHAGCAVVVAPGGRLFLRDGRRFSCRGADPAVAGSVLLALLAEVPLVEGELTVRVRVGGGASAVTLALALLRDAAG